MLGQQVCRAFYNNTNIIDGKILFSDANLKAETDGIQQTIKRFSEEAFDQSHKFYSPTSYLFKPVSSSPAPIDNLLVDDPENQAVNLQTYSYQDTD
jgi:hypothetical protein